PQDGSQD
ncbi:hypothetical protein BN1708_020674, partial [Verticillium longisporum]